MKKDVNKEDFNSILTHLIDGTYKTLSKYFSKINAYFNYMLFNVFFKKKLFNVFCYVNKCHKGIY